MREEFNDLWSYKQSAGYIKCITTNGFVKRNGEAVMGRGCALEAKERLPWLPMKLGQIIQQKGNHVHEIRFGGENEFSSFQPHLLLTFPVKHNWWELADPTLIERSCVELLDFADRYLVKDNANYTEGDAIVLPRPGCGNGGLDWLNDVKPILKYWFDDRFIIVHKEGVV